MRRRAVRIVAIATVVAAAGMAPAADATLRSTPLTSSCADGFAYEELTVGPWRVEGCHREGQPQGSEQRRERFKGKVELNGLIVEGSSELIVTTTSTAAEARSARARAAITARGEELRHRVTRASATVVLDPLVNGVRKRFVLSSGVQLDYSATTVGDATASSSAEIDIPVSSSAKVLGLRVRDRIRNVEVVRGGNGVRGGMVMRLELSLGSGASSLLRDWTTRTTVQVLDGSGMTLGDLGFRIGDIVLPGIGGFKDFSISYGASRDEWTGSTRLDLGDVLPEISFSVSVSASTGVPTRIEATVSGLALPIGSTSIILREIRGVFQQSPLIFGAGLTATGGPQIGPRQLLEISGDIEIKLEPGFRLEVEGRARVLPTSDTDEIARGTASFVLDSAGYIAMSADVAVRVRVLGIGAGATARGSGAYAWNRDAFNVEAGMTGTLYAGFLGDFEVARLEAVVSHDGWGTCGELAGFLRAGVGQQWGRNPDVFLSCDLSDYRAPVRAAQAGDAIRFLVPEGARKVGLLITGAAPEPRAVVLAPGGDPVVSTAPLGVRTVPDVATVVARPGQTQQLVILNRPRAGVWRVRAAADGPAVTDVKIARDLEPVTGDVSVARVPGRPGLRRLALRRLQGLDEGETVTLAIRTPRGLVPIGAVRDGAMSDTFDEVEPGRREIVALVRRNGVPNPGRTRVLGTYTAALPGQPGAVMLKRVRRTRLVALAKPAADGEVPEAWQYIVFTKGRPIAARRGRPGRSLTFTLPKGTGRVTVLARPVIKGQPAGGNAVRSATVK